MKTILTRLGLRLFRREELKQAFHRLADPNVELRNTWERMAWAFMRSAQATGLLARLRSEYLRVSHGTPRHDVYNKHYLNLTLNRVYDLPDVEVDPTRPRTVNVLVPAFDFSSMSAGFFGVFHVAQFVRRIGYNVRLVLFDNFYFNHEEFRVRFRDYPGMESLLDDLELVYIGDRTAPLRVSRDDTCIATVWYSAWFARKIADATGSAAPFLYLIQDYETRFFPGNSLAALAEQSYSFNYFALFSTEPLRDYFLRNDIGRIGSDGKSHAYFNNACSSRLVERSAFRALNEAKKKRRIVFYSRPVVDRNMFELAALTLIRAFEDGIFDHEEWECVGMGLGEAVISFGDGTTTTALPRMTLREYQEAVAEFDICLTLMASPHPSLVPMDLAGSGAVVVTNTFETKTASYLEGLSGNIIPAEPDVAALLAALRIARDRCDDLDGRHRNASTMAYPRDWSQSFQAHHRDFIVRHFGPVRQAPAG